MESRSWVAGFDPKQPLGSTFQSRHARWRQVQAIAFVALLTARLNGHGAPLGAASLIAEFGRVLSRFPLRHLRRLALV